MDAIRVFRRASAREPGRVFAFDRWSSITYAEADARSDAIAADLVARCVSSGRPIGLCAPDCVDLLLAILGAWKAGALPCLIDARMTEEDLSYLVQDIGASYVATIPELHECLRAADAKEVIDLRSLGAQRRTQLATPLHGPDSTLYLSYTSGTTGRPKGAVLLSGPVTLGTGCIADRLGIVRDDTLLVTTPTSSSFQLVAALLPAMHAAATIGLAAGSTTDEIWAIARQRRATVLIGYPLTLADMVNAPGTRGDCPFRLALSGGSPLAPRIKSDYRKYLGIPLVESYGQSEFGGFMALGNPADDARGTAGFVGRPLPDRLAYVAASDAVELPAGEVGEIVVPEGFFAGFWNKPDATANSLASGVLHTGDVGVADPDGYIKVLGRIREREAAETRGGFLRHLEDAYYEHPDVLHAAVVESEDGPVEAFIEPRKGRAAEAERFTAHAAARVAEGLRPRQTTILSQMPRTFSGKADRRRLSRHWTTSGRS